MPKYANYSDTPVFDKTAFGQALAEYNYADNDAFSATDKAVAKLAAKKADQSKVVVTLDDYDTFVDYDVTTDYDASFDD
jgi:hypothetical protein